ncbi:hypothetical protein MQH10_15865, partial [Phenylobacterium aquaticum]|nr:hypothetical protein [Phenylobacterium aquaticum]
MSMTSTRKDARRVVCGWMGLLLGASVMAAPGLASASSLDLFYERTVMAAADTRCGLFSGGVGSALAAARVQARGPPCGRRRPRDPEIRRGPSHRPRR